MHHLVDAAVEAGTLRQVRGVWQLRGRAAVSAELASLVDERVEQLPDDVARALGLLALCEPLDLDTLSGLVGAGAVEQAETRGLIRIVADRGRTRRGAVQSSASRRCHASTPRGGRRPPIAR